MVRGIANSKIGFGDLILLLRYFFKLKVSTHPSHKEIGCLIQNNKKHRMRSLTGVNGKKPNMKKPRQDVGAFSIDKEIFT